MKARTKRKLKLPLVVKPAQVFNKLQRRKYLSEVRRKTKLIQKWEKIRIEQLQKITNRSIKVVKHGI